MSTEMRRTPKEVLQRIVDSGVKEKKRQHALGRKIDQAKLALRPCLEELATGAKEWQDSPAFYIEENDRRGEKNPFVVYGDSTETYKRSLRFLLQKSGSDMHQIASELLVNKQGDPNFDRAVGQVEDYLSGLLQGGLRR